MLIFDICVAQIGYQLGTTYFDTLFNSTCCINNFFLRLSLVYFCDSITQFKEIGEDARAKGTVDAGKSSIQSNEKKKGFDWMFAKPVDEVKDHWVR